MFPQKLRKILSLIYYFFEYNRVIAKTERRKIFNIKGRIQN